MRGAGAVCSMRLIDSRLIIGQFFDFERVIFITVRR